MQIPIPKASFEKWPLLSWSYPSLRKHGEKSLRNHGENHWSSTSIDWRKGGAVLESALVLHAPLQLRQDLDWVPSCSPKILSPSIPMLLTIHRDNHPIQWKTHLHKGDQIKKMQVLRLNPENLKMDPDPAARWKFIGIHHKLCYLPSCHCFKLPGKKHPRMIKYIMIHLYPSKDPSSDSIWEGNKLASQVVQKGLGVHWHGRHWSWISCTIDVWADADSLIPWFIIHISVYIEVIYHTLNQLPATSSLEAKIFLVPSGVMLDSRDRSNCMYESIYVRQKRSLPICKLIVVS